MKQMADLYFRKKEHPITLPEDPLRNNRMKPLEGKKSGEDKKISAITEEKEGKMEHLTATYWG